ncbi:MAG: Kazal-type serine protease inhibitor domain-containing protein [Polyangiaceae bacterium]
MTSWGWRRWRKGAAIGLGMVLSIGACGSENVLVASLPDPDAGGLACGNASDCPPGSLCSMPSCGATEGVCAREPLRSACTETESPVCGCDKVTYYNDCLRLAAGVRAASPGACPFGAGKPCTTTCEEGATCARVEPVALTPILTAICSMPAASPASVPALWPGSCWVLPDACPPGARGDVRSFCPIGAQCLDTCTAIRTGGLYVNSQTCP